MGWKTLEQDRIYSRDKYRRLHPGVRTQKHAAHRCSTCGHHGHNARSCSICVECGKREGKWVTIRGRLCQGCLELLA
jgi:uncharacterized OB-fold protein